MKSMLSLDVTSEVDVFRTSNPAIQANRIYGGQLLAQSLEAAHRTVDDERPVHSMHGYFLRMGKVDVPIDFRVERLTDGRTLAHRRVEAVQESRTLFTSTFSFHSLEPGIAHQADMPAVPPPDTWVDAKTAMPGPMRSVEWEVRPVLGDGTDLPQGAQERGRRAVWMRFTGEVRDDPAFHQAMALFISDSTLFVSALSVHGMNGAVLAMPGTLVTSIDHSFWWHAPGRIDEWMLLVSESPQADNGRGFIHVSVYRQDGTLVASGAQELLIRIPGIGPESAADAD